MVINREQFINAENNSVRLLLHISRLYSLLYNGYYKEKYKYLIEAFIKRAGDNTIKSESLRYNIIKNKIIKLLYNNNSFIIFFSFILIILLSIFL